MSKSDKIPDTFIDRHDRDTIMRLLEEAGCDGYISKYLTALIATREGRLVGLIQCIGGALEYFPADEKYSVTYPADIVMLQKTRMPYDHL